MSDEPDLDQLLVQITGLVAKQGAINDFASGQVDDPASFAADGGMTGDLGFYPLIRPDGTTIYFACLARLLAGHETSPVPTTATLTDTDGAVLTDPDGATLVETL